MRASKPVATVEKVAASGPVNEVSNPILIVDELTPGELPAAPAAVFPLLALFELLLELHAAVTARAVSTAPAAVARAMNDRC